MLHAYIQDADDGPPPFASSDSEESGDDYDGDLVGAGDSDDVSDYVMPADSDESDTSADLLAPGKDEFVWDPNDYNTYEY